MATSKARAKTPAKPKPKTVPPLRGRALRARTSGQKRYRALRAARAAHGFLHTAAMLLHGVERRAGGAPPDTSDGFTALVLVRAACGRLEAAMALPEMRAVETALASAQVVPDAPKAPVGLTVLDVMDTAHNHLHSAIELLQSQSERMGEAQASDERDGEEFLGLMLLRHAATSLRSLDAYPEMLKVMTSLASALVAQVEAMKARPPVPAKRPARR